MKTRSILLFPSILLMGLVLSCNKDDLQDPNNDVIELCGVQNPVKNLTWLADIVTRLKPTSTSGTDPLNGVVVYKYKNEQVIEVQCGICSSTNIHQYKCDGTLFDFTNPTVFQEYLSAREKVRLIYGTEIWK